MVEPKILLCSQEGGLAEAVLTALPGSTIPYRLETIPGIPETLEQIERGEVWVALVHVASADDEEQLACLLKETRLGRVQVPVIAITEGDDPDQRRRLLTQGTVDCLPRPLDLSRLAFLLDVLTVRRRYESTTVAEQQPPPAAAAAHSVPGFLVVSQAMRELFSQISALASLDTTVLLTGETGTGKSHVAQVIHESSGRKGKPFVVVECGGLSTTLLESELFGHVRGAFTGADRDHEGKFAAAGDGTILLDEIDCVPLEAQARLLRVLERRVYEAVGSNRVMPCRARVVAATNRPLREEVTAGRFRSDLFFRLCVVEFRLPPLRHSREAVRPLAEKFRKDFGTRAQRPISGFTPAAMNVLEAYDWPGNIRELRNAVERAVALCDRDRIDVSDLPEQVRTSSTGVSAPVENTRAEPENPLAAARKHGELVRILEALERHHNNRARAAVELGISRAAFYKKLQQHGLLVPRPVRPS